MINTYRMSDMMEKEIKKTEQEQPIDDIGGVQREAD